MWTEWVQGAARSDRVLDWILRTRKLVSGDRPPFPADARMTLALALLATRQSAILVIEHPAPTVDLTIAATTGMLLADELSRHIGGPGRIPRDVLVITRQSGATIQAIQTTRLEYGIKIPTLWRVIPTRNALRPDGRGRPIVYVAPPTPGSLAPIPLRPGAIVLDATHPQTLERLEALLSDSMVAPASILVVILPLAASRPAALAGAPTWVWDPESIQAACRSWDVPNKPTAPIHWHRQIFVCPDDRVDPILAHVRTLLVALSAHIRGAPPLAVLQAWRLYYRLAHMAAPLSQIEEHAQRRAYARPIRDHLAALVADRPQDRSTGALGVLLASEWPPVLHELQEAYEHLLGSEPAKFWGLAHLVEEHIQAGFPRPLVIACSTEIERDVLLRELSMVCMQLHHHLHPEGLIMSTLRPLAYHPLLHHYPIILPGPLSSRWLFLDAVLRETTVLAYPFEVVPSQNALYRALDRLSTTTGLEARHATLKRLMLPTLPHLPDAVPRQPMTAVIEVQDTFHQPARRLVRPSTPVTFDLPVWDWGSTDEPISIPLAPARGAGGGERGAMETGPLVRVWLQGESHVLSMPEGHMVDVYRPAVDRLEVREVERVQPGDILLLINDDEQASLFERIVEALESQPAFATIRLWVTLWNLAKLAALQACDKSYAELHRRLLQAGADIALPTVRSWYERTMAPQEEENIYRLIAIANDPAASAHQREIRGALGHVRGTRRHIGRRIGELLRQVATAREPERFMQQDLDLAVEDVLAAIRRSVVERVEVPGRAARVPEPGRSVT